MAESASSSVSRQEEIRDQDLEAEAQDELIDQIATSSHHQVNSHPQMGWDDSDGEEIDEGEEEEEEEEGELLQGEHQSGDDSQEENQYDEDDDDPDEEEDENEDETDGIHQVPSRAWAESSYDDPFAYHQNEDDQDGINENAPLRVRSSRPKSTSLHPPASLDSTPTFKHRVSSIWLYLTKGSSHSRGKGSGGGLPNSLSLPLVASNLFAASLHPGVLLSMPYYFSLAGTGAGITALMVIAILGGVGGGLWVVLSRYVQGLTVEEITGQSCGRNNKWKGNVGRCLSGLLLACYAMGAAWVAYAALSDLLLQIFFHYSPRGIPLHDRSFVTFVIGGLLTTPLVIFPLAKRNLIKLSTWLALLCYPAVVTVLIVKTRDPQQEPAAALDLDSRTLWQNASSSSSVINFNPLNPPSIWAPVSLLPLLTLSSSPLQILAHNRSLRRKDQAKSNVKAFMVAQILQVMGVVAISTAVGIGIQVGEEDNSTESSIGPNFFSSLSASSDLYNVCRTVFVLLLSSHLSLCLVTARSSWGRVLKLLRINPFRKAKMKRKKKQLQSTSASTSTTLQTSQFKSKKTKKKQKKKLISKLPPAKHPLTWSKLARNSLAGFFLWSFTSILTYLSSSGGFRKKDRLGEEARFVLVTKICGLLGAFVGFVLPGLSWFVLFHLRQPRAILPRFSDIGNTLPNNIIGRKAAGLVRGTLGLLAGRRNRGKIRLEGEETQLLLPFGIARSTDGQILNDGGENDALPDIRLNPRKAARDSRTDPITSFNEHDASVRVAGTSSTSDREGNAVDADDEDEEEATINILLARKERQLQKRSRGRRKWQDLLVLAALIPLGLSIIILGSLDLRFSKSVKW